MMEFLQTLLLLPLMATFAVCGVYAQETTLDLTAAFSVVDLESVLAIMISVNVRIAFFLSLMLHRCRRSSDCNMQHICNVHKQRTRFHWRSPD